MPSRHTITIEYDKFIPSDFDEYQEEIKEWILENKEVLKKSVEDAWVEIKDYFCFHQYLDTSINAGEDRHFLWDSTRESIYDNIDEVKYDSTDDLFPSFQLFFNQLKATQPQIMSNE